MGFSGGYHEWRIKRIAAITEYMGADWFRGKKVLELACGYGDIGIAFWALGADVVFSDGRNEHLQELRSRYPMIAADKIIWADLEEGIKLPASCGSFDLIIHHGVLYHLNNWRKTIEDSARLCRHLMLETEVCDSNDETLELKTTEDGYDQALSKVGSRPSAALVEQVLVSSGFHHERLRDDRCNANIHRYDWPVTDRRSWDHGLRRFWFCERKTEALSETSISESLRFALASG